MKSIRVLCLILAFILIVVGYERKLTKSLKLGHDIAITGISVLSRGLRDYTVPVVVNIENQGDCGESFDVKLIDVTDGKEIGRKSVTLPAPGGDGIDGVCDLILTGEAGGKQYFGDYIAVGGDVNGDGYKDILISSAGYPNGGLKGRAYLYYGGTNMDAVADKTFTGENNGDYFSDGIHSIADLNNDNFDDLMIGATAYNSNAGRLYIYYGGTDMDEVADIIIDSPDGTGCHFGFRPSVGDVNNDGYMDLFVTALKYNNGTGRVYLYYGPIASDATVDKTFTGENTNDWFGQLVVADGDIDNDNYDDLCISSRKYPNDGQRGRVYLYWGASGTSMDETCDLTFSGGGKWELGCGLEVHDIDNDNYADLLIGAQQYNHSEGIAFLHWGDARGSFDTSADLTFSAESGGDNFGNYIQAGYADDDQYADIMINAWSYADGRCYLYYGSTRGAMDNVADHTFEGAVPNWQSFQTHLVDVNNDGYGDVVRSGWRYNNYQGRALLWYGGHGSSTKVTFYWDTTKVSKGKHSLKAKVGPVAGEKDTADNTVTTEVNVKTP